MKHRKHEHISTCLNCEIDLSLGSLMDWIHTNQQTPLWHYRPNPTNIIQCVPTDHGVKVPLTRILTKNLSIYKDTIHATSDGKLCQIEAIGYHEELHQ